MFDAGKRIEYLENERQILFENNRRLTKIVEDNTESISNQVIIICELREEIKMLKKDLRQKDRKLADLIKEKK